MATIRHRESKFGWLHVLTVAVLLLGFGLTAAGPGGAAYAARGSGGGHSGGRSGGASFSHQGGSATMHMSSRSRSSGSFNHSTGFGSFNRSSSFRSTSVPGLSPFSSSLHMRGLSNLGRMDYRPLDTRTLIGPRPIHEPQTHFNSPLSLRRGDDFPGVIGSRYSGSFPGVIGGVGSRRFDRDDFVRFGNDRFFDFGRYDHYRDSYRFDRDDYARFHTYGFYSYRCPTIVPYDTYLFPDTFLFGSWFGSDVSWWSGNVCPSAGVTVVLVF